MPNFLARLTKHSFLRHNAVYFAGSVAFGGLNYLYYPIIGRLLDPLAFGEVQLLVSFFLQLTIFLMVLGMVTSSISANYEDEFERNRIIFDLERIALGVSVGLLVLSVVCGGWLQDFFHFSSTWPFAILALAVVAGVPFTFRSAYIRGQHGFGRASAANVFSAATKIVCSVGLVLLGLGTAGALWGVAASQFIAFCVAAYWARALGLRRGADHRLLSRIDLRRLWPELKYAGFVLVCSLVITLQFSVDILIVKHYFDAHIAGLYAGVATVARIIFFLTAAFAQVLLPLAKLKNNTAMNRRLLMKSFGLLVIISLPVLLGFVLAPEFVVTLLVGGSYRAYAELLPVLSLAIFVVSVINLIVAYYMALRRYAVAWALLPGALVTYTLMAINHDSLQAVIHGLLYGSVVMMILIGALAISPWLKARRSAAYETH